MTSIQAITQLAAERERVFRYLTDPANFPEYVAGYTGGHVTTPNDRGPGATIVWKGGIGPLRLEVEEQVVRWDEGREVAYEGRCGPSRFSSSMRLDDAGAGATRLAVGIDYSIPALLGGRATEALVRPLVEADVNESVARLRDRFGVPAGQGPTPEEVVAVYRKRARRYDAATQLYRLAFPMRRYRRLAVDALSLRRGATVVEIGCGTGANFPLLQERVGPTGRIIGVDVTDAMLEEARRRVAARGWTNVELVLSDAGRYEFPDGVDAVLSTLALGLSPDFDHVIERGARALSPNGRWAILDLKLPDWPAWALAIGLAVSKPYAVSLQAASRHPWEVLRRVLPDTRVRELYFGATYLAVGVKGPA